jgi:hypothetical protein
MSAMSAAVTAQVAQAATVLRTAGRSTMLVVFVPATVPVVPHVAPDFPAQTEGHALSAAQANSKQLSGLSPALTVQTENTLRQSQLLQRAHARRARRILTHLRGVVPSRIVAVIKATQEAMVALAQSVWQARLRMILDLVRVVNVKAVNTQPWWVPRRKIAHLVHPIRLHHQAVMTMGTVYARLDITETHVHARNVCQESSKSRLATTCAAIVLQARIPRRLVKRQMPLAFCARQVNIVRLQDGELTVRCVLPASTQTNQEQTLLISVRSVPQERHHQQAVMQWRIAYPSARQA